MAVARKVINRRVRYETELLEQKKVGHPFFPYAMFHDTVVNLIIVLMIVAMAVIWHATAGPINHAHPTGQTGAFGELYQVKANPAVQATEPRPDWYFLFLFELLRIFKQPWQLLFATIIIPTIMMVLLVIWPFIDRGRDRRLSRRPVGVAVGLTVPTVLISLTLAGSVAPGALTGTELTGNPKFDSLPATQIISSAGCTSCHFFGKVGSPGPGPSLAKGPANKPTVAAIEAQIKNGGGAMPPFGSVLTQQQIATVSDWLYGLKTGTPPPATAQ